MSIRSILIASFVSILFPISRDVPTAHWYVDASVTDSGTGTTWGTALKTIQEGINAASDGDTVIVGEGTYFENVHFSGKNIVLRSTDPLDPIVVANTIIRVDQGGSVITFSGSEDETCVISGFTLCGGNASEGGGIHGGTKDNHTLATIEHNTITSNAATYGGGLYWCDGTIRNNIISQNSASGNGGGLQECQGTIQKNTIAANTVMLRGGGLYACDGTIENNTISENQASEGGGLAYCGGTIRNNTVVRNSGYGAGLYECNGTIYDCIIWGNDFGGQIAMSSGPTYSCIQDWTGGGQGNIFDDPRFLDPDGPDNDPATYEDNNYRLSLSSPCIDAAVNEEWMWDAVDLDGNPRISYGISSLTVDMGAYEYTYRIEKTADGRGVQLNWNSRSGDVYTIWSCSDLWTGIWNQDATVSSQGQSTTWTDPDVTGKRRFYRVESAGVYTVPLGFVNVSAVRNGLTMISVPLAASDTRLNGAPGCIGDMIKENLTGGTGVMTADVIWKWDASIQSYKNAFLIAGWGEGYDGRWFDEAAGDFSDPMFQPGECCWIDRTTRGAETVTITFLGQAPIAETTTVTFVKGLTMFNWPYPTTLVLNDSTLGEIGTGGLGSGSADMVWKWDALTQSYKSAFLIAGWGAPYDGKWWDSNTGDFSDIQFEPGTALWYLRRPENAAVWICSRPY